MKAWLPGPDSDKALRERRVAIRLHSCSCASLAVKFSGMEHRHLKHCDYSMAAIDDIIARGGRKDWVELRNATADPGVVQKILRVCQAHTSDPCAQRYHLWRHYASRTAA